MAANASSSSFERLPEELKMMILCMLPTPTSLLNTVLSCSSLHLTFGTNECHFARAVIQNQLGVDLMYDVTIHREILFKGAHDDEMIRDFITNRYCKGQSIPNYDWTLQSALSAEHFHHYVAALTGKFIEHTSSAFPAAEYSPTRWPATSSELARIWRAFYRYEIFTHVFPPHFSELFLDDDEPMVSQYLNKFSPWENEQLACIMQFFTDQIQPIFNNFALYDIEWAAFGVGSRANHIGIGCNTFQWVLSRGIVRLGRLIYGMKTHNQRTAILAAPDQRDFLWTAFYILAFYLQVSADTFDSDTALEDLTPEQQQTLIKPPFFDDSDPGPESVWRKAYRLQHWHTLVNVRTPDLSWGYVMWDMSRLHTLVSEESAVGGFRLQAFVTDGTSTGMDTGLAESFEITRKRRTEIYDRGGRGFWSMIHPDEVNWDNKRSVDAARRRLARTKREQGDPWWR